MIRSLMFFLLGFRVRVRIRVRVRVRVRVGLGLGLSFRGEVCWDVTF